MEHMDSNLCEAVCVFCPSMQHLNSGVRLYVFLFKLDMRLHQCYKTPP